MKFSYCRDLSREAFIGVLREHGFLSALASLIYSIQCGLETMRTCRSPAIFLYTVCNWRSRTVSAGLARETTRISTGFQLGRCTASQMGRSFMYDCEYFGTCQRLVLTPPTERAFLNLTLALKDYQCGVVVGPTAVGKCSTIADLAVVSAFHFRCS
jgi:hypothetical protein